MPDRSRYGLIGKTLGHSFSKTYFTEKFKRLNLSADYLNFELASIEDISDLLKAKDLKGLNVTIPYKEEVIPFLDRTSEVAKSVGAVNTIAFKDNEVIGYNTDVIGFEQSLKPLLKHGMHKALVLGTGGASKAVTYVLKKIGLDVLLVSRNPIGQGVISYDECNKNAVKWHRLIVNTTPLGTYPDTKISPPIDYEGISDQHLLYDLIYNPTETRFLLEGKKRGAEICNGLDMLKIQAEESWKIWNQ